MAENEHEGDDLGRLMELMTNRSVVCILGRDGKGRMRRPRRDGDHHPSGLTRAERQAEIQRIIRTMDEQE
jgi:hypothetical protein